MTGTDRFIIGVLTETSILPSIYYTSLSSILPYITPQSCIHSLRVNTGSDKHVITFSSDKHFGLVDRTKEPQGNDTVSTGGDYKCNQRNYPWEFFCEASV